MAEPRYVRVTVRDRQGVLMRQFGPMVEGGERHKSALDSCARDADMHNKRLPLVCWNRQIVATEPEPD